jgi:hypothetical protein
VLERDDQRQSHNTPGHELRGRNGNEEYGQHKKCLLLVYRRYRTPVVVGGDSKCAYIIYSEAQKTYFTDLLLEKELYYIPSIDKKTSRVDHILHYHYSRVAHLSASEFMPRCVIKVYIP